MTTATVDLTFPSAKPALTESGQGGGGRFTGLSRLLLKHGVGRGPVHLLNAYWPVLCCSSPRQNLPRIVDRDRPAPGCTSGSRQRRLRGRCQSKAPAPGVAAGPGPFAPAASEGWRAALPGAPPAAPQPRRRRRSAELRGSGRPRPP